MKKPVRPILDAHDAEHFRLALLAVKDAQGLTGADIDRRCDLAGSTTAQILGKKRNVYIRYVNRYCKVLGIDPVKPWGILTCPQCNPELPMNGVLPVVSDGTLSLDFAVPFLPAQGRLRRIQDDCAILLRQAEQNDVLLDDITLFPFQWLDYVWDRVSWDNWVCFFRGLPEDERDMVLRALENT